MISHMSHALSDLPAIRGFLEEVDSRVVLGDYASFWRAIDGFGLLVDRSVWRTFYASVVQKLVVDPKYNGGRDWGVYGFTICESDKIHFSIRSTLGASVGRNVIDARSDHATSVASTMTAPSALIVASDAPVTFNVFQVPAEVDLDVFDPSVRIHVCDPVMVDPWTRVDVRAPRETLELVTDPGDEYCIIELAMRSSIAQRWEFDRRSGAPIGPVLISRDTAVLRSMLEEIARFRYVAAMDDVLDLANHPDFNVRWAAVSCAWAIDPVVGEAAIRRAAGDVHPYIRRAASAALGNLRKGASNAH
jgi:hypothetical protein